MAGANNAQNDRSGNYAASVVITVFLSIALYNAVELNVGIFTTFRRYRGLYFYSILAATWGIVFNAIGYLLRHYQLTSEYICATFILVGWCPMVTGQSLVLYSRLHLVVSGSRRLNLVLAMIIVNAILMHIPIIVLVYGTSSPSAKLFKTPYAIWEKIQLTVFFLQESIISGLYILGTLEILKLERAIGYRTNKTLARLIYVNILVILLDACILSLEYVNLFNIQTAWKPLAYSVKLKTEFIILNSLVNLCRGSRMDSSANGGHQNGWTLGGMSP